MAEIVQRQSENMIKELEDLRQTKLFPDDLIRRVLKIRKQMESKINGKVTKNIDDYKSYIYHETLILEKLKKCRNKRKLPKNSVEQSITKRIGRLYETALQRFPSDYDLHEGFFKFCKENTFHTRASQAVENMIKLFPYRPEVWKLAAGWYCHINDIDKALKTLHKGQTNNPESMLLYTTEIELDLEQVTNSEGATEDEKLFNISKCSEKIKVCVSLILKNVKNLEYIISTLNILQRHSFTNQAQDLILMYLFQNYAEEDIVWHMLADRERKGMHFRTDPDEKPRSGAFTKSCILYCIDKYKQGLSLVPENKKKKLWSHYLETLINIKEESHTSASVSRIDLLKEALEEAHSHKYLEERHYSVWVDLLSEEEARKILEDATEMNPLSEELWKLRLKYAIMTDNVPLVNKTFKQGVIQLKERALNLWLMVLRFHLLVSDNEVMVSIFEDGIKHPPEIANVLKPKYIEWIAFHESIETARTKYKNLAMERPFCKELHLRMSKLESSEIVINHKSWQKVHELAWQQFGGEDVEIGINFIKFLLFSKQPGYDTTISKIRVDAKKRLPSFLWEEFNEKCEKVLAESQNF